MIAIHLRFPHDRRAGGGAPLDWPPSTARFLHALTAVFHHGCPVGVTRPRFRRILEHLSTPPHFFLPDACRPRPGPPGDGRRRIVPVDRRVRPAPDTEMVWWWTEARLSGEDRGALEALLGRLPIYGGLDRWCEATLLPEAETQRMLRADVALAGEEPVRVLLPDPRAREAERKHRTRGRREPTREREDRMRIDAQSGVAGNAAQRGPEPSDPAEARSRAAAAPRLQVVRYQLLPGEMPRIEDALLFCEHAREALIWLRSPAGHSPVITGKRPDGQPLEGHGHAHYLATDEDGDGGIDHLTLFAQDGFDADDLETLLRFNRLTRHDRPDLGLALVAMGEPATLRGVPLFGPARRWRSVTPFSLPWFASRGAGKGPRPRDLPEGQLRRALALHGYPAPVRLEPRAGYACTDGLELPWAKFRTERLKKGTRGHGLAGFELEFAEPLTGPLAVGFAAHFGLGLFLPLP